MKNIPITTTGSDRINAQTVLFFSCFLFIFIFITIDYLNTLRQDFLLQDFYGIKITSGKVINMLIKYIVVTINYIIIVKILLADGLTIEIV